MKRWKRALAISLAVCMSIGMCSCGGKKGSNNAGADGKGQNANAALGKQYVYSMEEYDLSSIQDTADDLSIMTIQASKDKVYAVLQYYNYGKGQNGRYRLVSMKQDGSDIKSVALEIVGEPEPAKEEGAAQTDPEENGAIVPRTEDVVTPVDEAVQSGGYENNWYQHFTIAGDHLYGIRDHSMEKSAGEEYVFTEEFFVECWDLEGKLAWEKPIDFGEGGDESWHYINGVIGSENGRVDVLYSGDDGGVLVIDREGNVSEPQKKEALGDILNRSIAIMRSGEDKLNILYYSDNLADTYLVSYDVDKDEAGQSVILPGQISYNGVGANSAQFDESDNLYFSTSIGIYCCKYGSNEITPVMNYVNSNLETNNMNNFLLLDDKHFIGFYTIYDAENDYKGTLVGGRFTYVAPEDIPDKQVLVLGGSYIDGDLKKRVIEYNKKSDTHRIVLKDYSQYNTYESYNAGVTQLNNDILAGNMPDILIMDGYNMVLGNYVSKGLLADIGEMIEKDEELSEVDFIDNVLDACRIDGKLYEIIPQFSIQTYIAKKSIVGDRSEWTMKDVNDLMATLPETTTLFGDDMTRGDFMDQAIAVCGEDFVDISSGKCHFDSEEFIDLLKYAKTLPEELADDYYTEDWYVSSTMRYREDRAVLASVYLSSFASMVYDMNGNFGEEVSFIGFPCEKGNGSMVRIPNSYVISAKSECKDVAWEFLRYYLADEYQSKLTYTLPITKKNFDICAEQAMKKPVYQDENGNDVEDDYVFWIGEESVELDPLTQAQAEEVKAAVGRVEKRAYNNTDVINIITEEAAAFFAGQKSAEDVAAVIQSRVQLFVNENQ